MIPVDPMTILSNSLQIAAENNFVIADAVKVATFLPQPFWLLLIFLPNANFTKSVMGPLISIIGVSALHFFIVVASITQQDGSAPIAEFANVFDLNKDSLTGMLGMMKYPNFVAEEWSHVLAWDLFVGRWIWLDGLKRNVFTSHSVLLTNLIGPPGLLLHFLTCLVLGKPLPDDAGGINLDSVPDKKAAQEMEVKPAVERADVLVKEYFSGAYDSVANVEKLITLLSDDIVWDDTADKSPAKGRISVIFKLLERQESMVKGSGIVLDKIADGSSSSGFTWYYTVSGVEGKGLRGTTFVSFNSNGEIDYVREIAEPLFKPGTAIIPLLKAVTEKATKDAPPAAAVPFTRREPTSASDLVTYLWKEAQGQDKTEFLKLISEDIVYEDFNYKEPFIGKQAVAKFLDEFNFPGITFVPEKISDGEKSCCFTWRVELAGVEQSTKGISFYGLDDKTGKLSYLRDIPAPAIKPPPLRALAKLIRPGLQRFSPIK